MGKKQGRQGRQGDKGTKGENLQQVFPLSSSQCPMPDAPCHSPCITFPPPLQASTPHQ
ncbi:hypothetical protein COO91_05088 [Nostoc flagelliforme CCNUN1]|uniref:Uncharacterized protein n=1 Tax=Nostoc flagelliforme CCNUN1 TaxID=2038116 RepID=A0A2K8SUR8_9NOSO|nr:hypothetical protein COO91_05088 [Nostoc flagelliforme CCNUN1]